MTSEPIDLSTMAEATPAFCHHSEAPIALTAAVIREFQRLIEEHCGMLLSETEAWNRATELVALYRMFLGPIPEDPMVACPPGGNGFVSD